MKNISAIVSVAIAIFLTIPVAVASNKGEVEADAIEAQAGGETTAGLTAIFIDHHLEGHALPKSPAFHLESPTASVISHHTPLAAGDIDVGTRTVPVHEGQTTVEGIEARPGLHFWITPLEPHEEPTVTVVHQACTTLQPPTAAYDVRHPTLNRSRPDLRVDTTNSTRLASCTEAHILIMGSLSMILWEWDVEINGERVKTGVHDEAPGAGSTGTGAGSADELEIQAHNATLRISLTPETYTLHLSRPELVARDLRIRHAEGTLPGVLEPAYGADVELSGDYTTTITPQGLQQPLAAVLEGTTQTASIDGQSLRLQQTTTSSDPPAFLAGGAVLGFMAAAGAVLWFAWPLLRRRFQTRLYAPASTPTAKAMEAPTPPLPTVQGRDVEAERAVLRVVRQAPGVTVRRLQERTGISKARCAAALEALLARGVVVRKGSETRWHLFEPSPDLDKTWEQKVAKQEPNLRLLLAVLEEHPGAEQRFIIAVANKRFGWSASTTKARLQRLATVGLAEVTKSVPPTKSVPRGTLFVTWQLARPTEGK